MSGTVTSIGFAEVLKKRKELVERQAQVWTPILMPDFPYYRDPCGQLTGIIKEVSRYEEEGEHKGKWFCTIRFETPRGYIMHSYLEEELRILD